MQKLSGTSSGKNDKNCSFFATNLTKLSLRFSVFSTILYGFTKSAKWHCYLRFTFATRPLKVLDSLQICPWFPKNTLETLDSLQCRPWHRRWRGWPEFRRAGGALGRGRGGEELGAHLGPSCTLLWGGEAGGEGARRRSRAACAWSSGSASSRPGLPRGRRCGLQ
jgi:hypothetical protein